MPGTEANQVKCEPASDEEDSNSQYAKAYFDNEFSSRNYVEIKTENFSLIDENASSDLLRHLQSVQGSLEELAPAPAGPAATPVREALPAPRRASLATLQPASSPPAMGSSLIDRHIKMMNMNEVADSADFVPLMAIKDEPSSEGELQHLSGDDTSDSNGAPEMISRSPKSWTQRDMEQALDALRHHHMSLTKASATYGIPSTTLWQRAHRLGIDTPKKEGGAKSWGEHELRAALHALRAGALSANRASKAYGIPSSTLYKIARREGIRLAPPFNAAPTAWRRADLARALAAIRCGASVQRAAAQYGIPSGTLYGRCKREGIELSRSNPTPWSEDAMGEALEAVRVGQMSINQAAIHYNLPYSSLYGRFKRCKYQPEPAQGQQLPQQAVLPHPDPDPPPDAYYAAHATPTLPPLHTYMTDDYGDFGYYAPCDMPS